MLVKLQMIPESESKLGLSNIELESKWNYAGQFESKPELESLALGIGIGIMGTRVIYNSVVYVLGVSQWKLNFTLGYPKVDGQRCSN